MLGDYSEKVSFSYFKFTYFIYKFSTDKDAATKEIFKLSMAPVLSANESKSFMKDLVVYSPKEDDKYKKYLL